MGYFKVEGWLCQGNAVCNKEGTRNRKDESQSEVLQNDAGRI